MEVYRTANEKFSALWKLNLANIQPMIISKVMEFHDRYFSPTLTIQVQVGVDSIVAKCPLDDSIDDDLNHIWRKTDITTDTSTKRVRDFTLLYPPAACTKQHADKYLGEFKSAYWLRISDGKEARKRRWATARTVISTIWTMLLRCRDLRHLYLALRLSNLMEVSTLSRERKADQSVFSETLRRDVCQIKNGRDDGCALPVNE